jgi:carbonic anhydrase
MVRLVAVFFFISAALAAAQSGANWSYEGKTGPIVWGKLDPSYQACAKGHEQSPLDIHSAHLDKSLQPLEFHNLAGSVVLENTGRGIVVHVKPGSTMTAAGVSYQLDGIEFHHPSEHPVKGKLSDMEADLIYRSNDGKKAIVAVRLNANRDFPNALLSTLWPHLPTKAGASEPVSDIVSAGALLPGDRGYWAYVGSELTPPCTEGVRWFVFQEEIVISRAQLKAFANLFRMNTRPVQDAHGRKIEASE